MNQNPQIREERYQQDIVRSFSKQEKELHVLLVMPNDLLELYKEPLKQRMKGFGVTLVIAQPENIPNDLGSFNQVLAYQCPCPGQGEPEEPEDQQDQPDYDPGLFEIAGAPPKEKMVPFPRPSLFYTDIDTRLFSLKETVELQEKNPALYSLATMQKEIQKKLHRVQKYKLEFDRLGAPIQAIDSTYYQILGYFLKEATEIVLQLVTLGDVMKRYIKILIIDDMEERSLDRLEESGFRKRYISTMSVHRFNQIFHEFKVQFKKEFPENQESLLKLFYKSQVFKGHEIVLYNPWKVENGYLPVQFRLKKNPDLSKKEQRKLGEGPEKSARKIEKIEAERYEFNLQQHEAEKKLSIAETEGGMNSSAYIALNKKRKRLLRNANKKADELKELKKEISNKPHYTFYTRDFMQLLKDRKRMKKILPKQKLNLSDLESIGELIHRKRKIGQDIRQQNAKIKATLTEMQKYADSHLPGENTDYHQFLGIHTLDVLELTILGCCAAHLNNQIQFHPGSYYSILGENTPVSWHHERVSLSRLFIASKEKTVQTALLQVFFRVTIDEQLNRIHVAPSLPQGPDFDNENYSLFILNYDSYPYQEILECLKKRKQSKRPFIPVIIVDHTNRIETQGLKHIFEQLIGYLKTEDGSCNLTSAPYRVLSLEDVTQLPQVLCELLGIDDQTIPSAEIVDKALRKTDTIENLVRPVNESFAERPGSAIDDGTELSPKKLTADNLETAASEKIQLTSLKEKPEEIYTLGSLFSFDDDPSELISTTSSSGPTTPVKKSHKDLKSIPEDKPNIEDTNQKHEQLLTTDPEKSGESLNDHSHLF